MKAVRVLVALSLCATVATAMPADAAEERTVSSANFSITWTDNPGAPDSPDPEDFDGNAVPDSIDALLSAFEEARAVEVGELGYQPPPNDGPYRIYIGTTTSRGYTQPAPGGEGKSRASFIVVPPYYVREAPEASVRTFAAHEYFHAIQLGYDADEDDWIGEATATWMEELVVDESDRAHSELSKFVPSPRLPLFAAGGDREYGAFLFFQFLTERYGGGSTAGAGIVKEIWELMAVPEAMEGAPNLDSIGAIEAVLDRRGVTLEEAWQEFSLWRWRLSHFEEGNGYRTALSETGWPAPMSVQDVRTESCRHTSDTPEGFVLPPLSADYVRLQPAEKGPSSSSAQLTLEGPAHTNAFVIVKPRGLPPQERLVDVAGGATSVPLPFGASEVRYVDVGLINGSVGEEATVAYSLQLDGASRVGASPPTGPIRALYGVGAVLSGSVSCRKQPAPFADVVITRTDLVTGETHTFTTQTDAFGRWFIVDAPDEIATYSVAVVDPLLSAAESPTATRVEVAVAVTLQVESDRLAPEKPVRVTGQLTPNHPGVPIVIQFRRPEREWRTGAEVVADESGAYSAEFVLPADGVWQLRAVMTTTGDADHVPGASVPVLVVVGD